MAAEDSSSNPISSPPPLKIELKQEQQQDVTNEIKESNHLKREREDSKETVKIEQVGGSDVKGEPMDVKVKGEPMDVKREEQEEQEEDPFDFLESEEHIAKMQKHEAYFKQYLMGEYFPNKTVSGGNIYDVKVIIEGQTIKASRFPPYQSYIDPAHFEELLNGKEPVSTSTEASAPVSSNEKPSTPGN